MRQEKMIISSLWGEQCPAPELLLILAQGEIPLRGSGCRDPPHPGPADIPQHPHIAPNRERKKSGAENNFFSG